MWSEWFGGFAQPSDYPNAEPPSWNFDTVIVCLDLVPLPSLMTYILRFSVKEVKVSSVFVIPYISFLIILPGVRQKRIITLVVFTITCAIGAALGASLYYPAWTGGSARIVSQFRAHANERIQARIGVHIGLQSINISLKHEELIFTDDYTSTVDWTHLKYNEKFDISSVNAMNEALISAFSHGLPYPMLSVLEYFSLNQDAFDWGRHYRTAGHYTRAAVIFALCCWSLSVLFLLFLPHHYGKSFLATGLASLFACLLYLIMSPCQLKIGFVGTDGERIHMDMGFQWAFYLIFAAGIVAVSTGILLILLQHFRIYSLSTFLEASLDDTVGPKRRNLKVYPEDIANSIEVLQRCKTPYGTNSSTTTASNNEKSCDKSNGRSSGFQSRSSYSAASLRSTTSFETVHNEAELARSPSSLTLPDFVVTPIEDDRDAQAANDKKPSTTSINSMPPYHIVTLSVGALE